MRVHLTSISEKFEWSKMNLHFLCKFSSAIVDAVFSTDIVIGH